MAWRKTKEEAQRMLSQLQNDYPKSTFEVEDNSYLKPNGTVFPMFMVWEIRVCEHNHTYTTVNYGQDDRCPRCKHWEYESIPGDPTDPLESFNSMYGNE